MGSARKVLYGTCILVITAVSVLVGMWALKKSSDAVYVVRKESI